ncbi:NAD(P)/FAD-dependent oxidoreductase [Pseudonocardia halophobica]|uniref:Kynurenine 3-monooxygenase n=1 Tax=Pseudonocardia halophobica TaxID=29401 RepID=A0A9W6P155_9PSEU|nr:NAD(P)/FAD-dependent oxidoreductase [Pseudonocardia halophobica]GLL15929.1 kynurenine 3-monooxygenase [Pseudonocardia halophobica]
MPDPTWAGAPVERVAVVGAGLAGCLLAALLGRRGIAVDLYERRADPRTAGAERGRSINLAISARGLDALDRVGLADQALAEALPMRGRTLHPVRGALGFQSYSADGTRAINSIGRARLNHALLDCAEKTADVTLHFEHRLTAVDADTGTLTFAEGGTRQADVVIGADGAWSAVRRSLQFSEGFDFRQDFLPHGYKELEIPPTPGGDFALDPGSLHIWPRGSSMMIALPNTDRSFTCTLFWPKAGPGGFAALDTPEAVTAYFAAQYPDAVPLMPRLVEDFLRNPVGSLVTIRCAPWVRGRVALLGDAAHAIVPFFGQGANCAFEDCVELDRCLDAAGGDLARALPRYQERRKANAEAIADMALENFVEMSDRVNSPVFRWTARARHALERAVPGYVSRYELVSFTTVPYSEIDGRIRRQDRIAGAVALGAATGAAAAAATLRRVRS